MENTFKDPGALLDTRSPEAKAKDYKIEEAIAAFAPVNWIEKKPSEYRKFPIFDQDGSGSCVAQTGRKMLGVYIQLKTGVFVKLSAAHIYQRRSNKPGSGMGSDDVFKIMQKGTTLLELAPDEKLSDDQMDAVKVSDFDAAVGAPFKIGQYLTTEQVGNIDLIASLIQQTGKAVMVWFYFSNGLSPVEWTAVPSVQHAGLQLTGPNTARHSVAAVDFTLYNGKKALVIDDSWGPNAGNGAGQRIITEDFFKARNFFVGHFMNFAFEDQTQPDPTPVPGKPVHTFDRDLEFSAAYKIDAEVVALQNCLKWEGCFPTNLDSTGYYGSITRTAVEKFQVKYGIAKSGDAGFGRVGPMTRAKLNSLYSQ